MLFQLRNTNTLSTAHYKRNCKVFFFWANLVDSVFGVRRRTHKRTNKSRHKSSLCCTSFYIPRCSSLLRRSLFCSSALCARRENMESASRQLGCTESIMKTMKKIFYWNVSVFSCGKRANRSWKINNFLSNKMQAVCRGAIWFVWNLQTTQRPKMSVRISEAADKLLNYWPRHGAATLHWT